jgi:biopolymer transport protein ExbD
MTMSWQLRHAGSPKAVKALSLAQVVAGLRDGAWDGSDEVLGPGDKNWQALEDHPQTAEIAEELERPPQRRHEESTSIDMNALIDVCLVLLIFFILTTSYMTLVQKVVPLPAVKSDESKAVKVVRPDDVKKFMVRVQAYHDSAGRPVVKVENQSADVVTSDGKLIDPDKMRQALGPYVRGDDRKTQVLLDARDVSWENVIRLQDGARAAGIQQVRYLLKK